MCELDWSRGNLDNLEFGGCNFFLYDHTLTAVTELRKALTEDHLLSSIHSFAECTESRVIIQLISIQKVVLVDSPSRVCY